jgi:hypothetical protein
MQKTSAQKCSDVLPHLRQSYQYWLITSIFLCRAGIALIALAIVLEVIFGTNVTFAEAGIVDSIPSTVGVLGSKIWFALAAIAAI